ncbi:MAG: NAD-glutamate dehydrogenase, partial [Gammaproteobacteria bacterium]|nr:NAD-glutamate dehydrogenase [Gammaproteobacteria bacterium]
AKVRVFNPDPKRDGWHSNDTIVQVVNDDMPFLVDSLTMCLNELGRGIELTMHPILRAVRTRAGKLTDLKRNDNEADGRAESFIYMEIGKELDDAGLARITAALETTLSDVRAAVDDWQPMVAELRKSVEHVRRRAPSQSSVLEESCALIDWLADDHFTLLGYREYRLRKGKRKDRLVPIAETGLGLLREDRNEPVVSIDLVGLDQREARSKNPLVITKARRRSRVHRPGHLDQISLKTFGKDGAATGVRRFLGLFTSTAYNENPLDIPLVRLKVQQVMADSGLDPKSHRGKALQHILNNFPRDDLYQISIADLARISAGILDLQERRQVRLFCRRDALSRYYSCFVYLPRDHYTAPTRKRIEKVLLESFGGTHIETKLTISESVLARLEATILTPTAQPRAPRLRDVENRLRAAVASWSDKLRTVLLERLEEQPALELYHRFAACFPVSYQDEVSPLSASEDIEDLARLIDGASRIQMSLAPAPVPDPRHLRLRTCRLGKAIPLYRIVPILERMGMKVLSERVYRIDTTPATAWLQEVDLEPADAGTHDAADLETHFLGCVLAALDGDCENDEFNSFVVLAGLHWREAALLRAYCKHLLQTGLPFSQAYMHEVLARHPEFARALVEQFQAQFDPDIPGKTRTALAKTARAEITATLERVSNLDEDRILRAFLGEIDATLRTNFFQLENEKPKKYVALKLDPKQLVELPRPRPMFEIFVYSPRVEGVHLRGGRVARGGLRWSDRREDFRTEVLGLMKAQQVKNTIIVPTGAKGGFVCKQLPDGNREVVQAEVVACYKTFVSGLLDVTDNIVGERIVSPERVIRRDNDDPYLVVAADKGTATFSDIANEISTQYGFWLGDAFASGGSAGYDHKKMGITARGAWESVKRHFRELGTDIHSEPVTVIGIGDMSGDVFGNGMLLSEQLKLVAAFNHRHIFLDPEPDPAVSFAERKRLFELSRSGWDDYDQAKLSQGGGVYSRQAKSIELLPAAQTALGLDKSKYTPPELIRAILTMNADLLWNGGVGTYVKAQSESHTDAGDPANDTVRVDASELRCKVVGEGGNLGLTQLGRIEFALRGGLLYTDFIDNAGGVNSSDREVNIKILLNQAIRDDKLKSSQRNALLARMTDDIAGLVLEDNYAQTQALSMLNAHSFERLGENARLIRTLISQGLLDRALEFLPTEEGIVERRSLGKGLTQPELAVLLSYAKIGLTSQLVKTDIPEDTYLDDELECYFPPQLSKRFAASMRDHRLRRELIAMRIANHVINRMGPAFTYRTVEDTGATIDQVVRAYAIARDVFAIRPIWSSIQAADGSVPTALQYNLMFQLSRRLRRAVYWLLQRHSRGLDIGALVAKMRPMADAVTGQILELEAPASRKRLRSDTEQLVAMGVSPELARKLAALSVLPQTLDIIEIAEHQGLDVGTIARLYFGLGQGLEIKWIRQEIEDLTVEGRWQAVARDTLRQNLARQHCAVLGKILSARGSQRPRDALVSWLEARSADIARVRQIVHDMRASEGADFATLSVAIREIERLI